MPWRLILKIITGVVVIPVAILANSTWPWWQRASLPLKIITGPLILPIVGLAYASSFWWSEL